MSKGATITLKAPAKALSSISAITSRSEVARAVRAFLEKPDGIISAAEWVVQNFTKNKPAKLELTEDSAHGYLLMLVQQWLNQGDYLNAARLLWNEASFSVEPRSVRMIWEALPVHSEILVLGAGSLGKTFTAAVWFMLDWIRDPQWTCIKVISLTGQHAKRNCFAQMKNLHMNSSIRLPGEINATSIQIGEDDKQGIHLLAIPKGDSGMGSLRGFHTVPRGTFHPQFGKMSRVRALLDEAEEIPHGAWEGVNNLLNSKSGNEHLKVFAASNPKDRNSKFGQYCEPKDGWDSLDKDTSDKWQSKLGWHVIRLDGAKCENVVQRKVVFDGLLTWDGYQRYLDLGDDAPEYNTMARGWFPVAGLAVNVISHEMVSKAVGLFKFYGKTTYAAGVDLAFEGGDRAVMTVGRFGRLAQGGKFGLEINSQFELAHRKTVEMSDEIMRICKNLHIPPEFVGVDRTGNGTGVHDTLCAKFGSQVMGMMFGEASTQTKVLIDDSQTAEDLYDGLVTEVWFAMRKWLEFGFLKFSPACKMDILRQELTSRRYRQKGTRVRVESKGDYKGRGNKSCDYSDSLSILLHVVRLRSTDFEAYMLKPSEKSDEMEASISTGIVDAMEFVTFEE